MNFLFAPNFDPNSSKWEKLIQITLKNFQVFFMKAKPNSYQQFCDALKESLNISDLNIVNNNGPLAGQTVNHFHIHLIPRYEGDKVSFIYGENKISNEDFISLASKISCKLK